MGELSSPPVGNPILNHIIITHTHTPITTHFHTTMVVIIVTTTVITTLTIILITVIGGNNWLVFHKGAIAEIQIYTRIATFMAGL
jgi:hypothetical protein